jgi:hypothetical protein
MAGAFGMHAERVERTEDLPAALALLLIDLRCGT